MGAGFFALATATRSMMCDATSARSVALMLLPRDARRARATRSSTRWSRCRSVRAVGASTLATKYWTAPSATRCCRRSPGLLLANRVLWLAVALVLFALAYARRSASSNAARRRARTQPADAHGSAHAAPAHAAGRRIAACRGRRRPPRWAPAAGAGPFRHGASSSAARRSSCCSASACSTRSAAIWFAGECYGSRLLSGHAHDGASACNGAFTLIPVIIAIYYAGELVWRDRERRVHEIVDATPAPDWAHVVPEDRRDHAGAGSDGCWSAVADRHGRAGAQGLHALRARALSGVVRVPVVHQLACNSRCWRCSCRRWCRTSSSAGA